jgi:phage shock protein E
VLRRLRPLAVLIVLLVVAGCAGAEGSTAPAAPDVASLAEAAEGRTLIDVRTPDEVAEGALAGALTMDLQSGAFAAQVVDLERDEPYFVYCRTGRRSAEAVAMMRDLGFTDVVDGGGFADLADAGLPTDP